MNREIVEAYKEWLTVCQGHPEAAAMLTLVQAIVEAYNVNAEEAEPKISSVVKTFKEARTTPQHGLNL